MTEIVRRVEQAKREKLANAAFKRETRIKGRIRTMRGEWVKLAKDFHAAHEERDWQLLGYDSLAAWLGSPEIEISEGHFHKLCRVYDEYVVVRQIDPERLGNVDLAKVTAALPAVKEGKAKPDKVLADAESLSRSDFAEKWGSKDPDAALDATKEKVVCPQCKSRVPPEKLEQAA